MNSTMQIKTNYKLYMNLLQVITVGCIILNMFTSCSGYIINEEGQLIPFKIYKKGYHGARAYCQRHPRNCGGGFRKRITGQTQTGIGRNGLNFQMKKRQPQLSQSMDNIEGLPFGNRGRLTLLEPFSESRRIPTLQEPETNKLDYVSTELYNVFPSLKDNFNLKAREQTDQSKSINSPLENIHEANQFINDLSRGLGLNSMDTSRDHSRPKTLLYPDYDILENGFTNNFLSDNDFSIDKDEDVFRHTDKMDLYQY